MTGTAVGGWSQGVKWKEYPQHLYLRPTQCVLAFGRHSVEVVDWKTANLIEKHEIGSSALLRVLSTSMTGKILVCLEEKKASQLYLIEEPSSWSGISGAEEMQQ